MGKPRSSRINDPTTVLRDYATEERFLARRLVTWAELHGPFVEDATVAAIAEGAHGRVLEVGCGTGDFSERLQRELTIELLAIDLSPRMVELTRSRGVNAMEGDVQDLPFADGAFDCVLANRVLYHVANLDQGLAEVARVLRPGGSLVAVTYSEDHLRELFDLAGASPIASTFSAESGAAPLHAHFDAVERRDVTGRAEFASTNAIRGCLASSGDFTDLDLAANLGDVQAPFRASYRHSIFLARKAH